MDILSLAEYDVKYVCFGSNLPTITIDEGEEKENGNTQRKPE